MITKEIKELLAKVLKSLNYPCDQISIIVSNRKDLCDYQYDGAFKLAKILHQSPMIIGSSIVSKWQELYPNDNIISKIESVNGFINFTLSSLYINQVLNQMMNDSKYSISFPKTETIVIDYGGPNIAKPLHVGHLRSAIVGESMKRMLSYAGNKMIADVHLGDYGLQIGEVIYGLQQENISLKDITLSKLEEIYPRISALSKEDEEVKNKCAEITKELQDGNQEYQEYFKVIKEISGNDIKRIYRYLDVTFDVWYGESDSYRYIPKATSLLNDKHLLVTSEGAKVVNVSKESDEKEIPPFIYQKSNGAYLYGTTDLATIVEREEDFHPDRMIYITDNRQSMHFTQLFRVCEQLGITTSFEHIGYGTVNGLDGKPYKTRNGGAPRLDDLFKETKEEFLNSNEKNKDMSEKDIDILVNAIIKFADLQNNWAKDYIFDIKKFSEVIGKTGPYTLYTYLRINSILKNEKESLTKLNHTIYNIEDRSLRLKLLELDSTFNYALSTRLPSVIANYIYELCVCLNTFYENNHINNLSDQEKKNNWLLLLSLSNRILKDMLNILSIQIPEKM